ncbi:MAG: hypothetical protein KF789_05255 [Bdellovibrionaceae bacterium]|nr:hypothetical protein [Pseudobdellovibrionaceae bacterium]
MKKTLLIAALSMAATPAFASKARLSALGGADHVSDAQRTFARPYEATMHGEYATVEFGTANGTPRAEGGFVRQISEGNYLGFYVNRESTALGGAIADSGINADAFAMDNSFDIFYGSRAGEIAWGANLFYLTSDKKAAYEVTGPAAMVKSGKSNDIALALGAAAGAWEADATIGLGGKASYVADTFTGPAGAVADDEVAVKNGTNIDLRGAYKMDNMHYFVRYGMTGSKVSVAGTDGNKQDNTDIELGLINTTKAEGAEFFYGVSYLMSTDKVTPAGGGASVKTETNSLPLIVGVEADAASWMVLRGSVRHVLPFLSNTKVTNGKTDTLPSNTTIAAGAGFKLNKFTIDTLFAAASSGSVGTDSPNFLTNASLTYNF